jgi:AraC-like DNA-binding protein
MRAGGLEALAMMVALAHAIDTELRIDTRRRLAIAYLRDARHTLTEIAYLLGCSEVSAFNRAFKRWTGSTPTDYRGKIAS